MHRLIFIAWLLIWIAAVKWIHPGGTIEVVAIWHDNLLKRGNDERKN